MRQRALEFRLVLLLRLLLLLLVFWMLLAALFLTVWQQKPLRIHLRRSNQSYNFGLNYFRGSEDD